MQCKHYGCEKEAAEGRKQCETHLVYARLSQHRRRQKLLEGGNCTRCGNTSRPNKTMCQACADLWNQYLKSRRANVENAQTS
jgi:uncharacterized OB-fold protein